MKRSKTRLRIRDGKVAQVCWLGHSIPSHVAHPTRVGYDYVWPDLEHHHLASREVEALLGQRHSHDVDGFPRLEDGAIKLMIPHVTNGAQTRQLASMVKFPTLPNTSH